MIIKNDSLFFKSIMFKDKKMIEVCDIILINKSNKVLMQLRDSKKGIYGPNKWGLLGGQKRNRETPKECIIREMYEEIGIKIKNPKLIKVVRDNDENIIFKHYIFLDYINKTINDIKLNEGEMIEYYSLEDIKLLNKVEWFNNVYLKILKKIV